MLVSMLPLKQALHFASALITFLAALFVHLLVDAVDLSIWLAQRVLGQPVWAAIQNVPHVWSATCKIAENLTCWALLRVPYCWDILCQRIVHGLKHAIYHRLPRFLRSCAVFLRQAIVQLPHKTLVFLLFLARTLLATGTFAKWAVLNVPGCLRLVCSNLVRFAKWTVLELPVYIWKTASSVLKMSAECLRGVAIFLWDSVSATANFAKWAMLKLHAGLKLVYSYLVRFAKWTVRVLPVIWNTAASVLKMLAECLHYMGNVLWDFVCSAATFARWPMLKLFAYLKLVYPNLVRFATAVLRWSVPKLLAVREKAKTVIMRVYVEVLDLLIYMANLLWHSVCAVANYAKWAVLKIPACLKWVYPILVIFAQWTVLELPVYIWNIVLKMLAGCLHFMVNLYWDLVRATVDLAKWAMLTLRACLKLVYSYLVRLAKWTVLVLPVIWNPSSVLKMLADCFHFMANLLWDFVCAVPNFAKWAVLKLPACLKLVYSSLVRFAKWTVLELPYTWKAACKCWSFVVHLMTLVTSLVSFVRFLLVSLQKLAAAMFHLLGKFAFWAKQNLPYLWPAVCRNATGLTLWVVFHLPYYFDIAYKRILHTLTHIFLHQLPRIWR